MFLLLRLPYTHTIFEMHFTVTSIRRLFNQVNHFTNNRKRKIISQCKIDPIHCQPKWDLRAKFTIYCFKYTQKFTSLSRLTFTIFIKRKEDADFQLPFIHKIRVNFRWHLAGWMPFDFTIKFRTIWQNSNYIYDRRNEIELQSTYRLCFS